MQKYIKTFMSVGDELFVGIRDVKGSLFKINISNPDAGWVEHGDGKLIGKNYMHSSYGILEPIGDHIFCGSLGGGYVFAINNDANDPVWKVTHEAGRVATLLIRKINEHIYHVSPYSITKIRCDSMHNYFGDADDSAHHLG